eukprot:192394-Rhodomonas_salina.2
MTLGYDARCDVLTLNNTMTLGYTRLCYATTIDSDNHAMMSTAFRTFWYKGILGLCPPDGPRQCRTRVRWNDEQVSPAACQWSFPARLSCHVEVLCLRALGTSAGGRTRFNSDIYTVLIFIVPGGGGVGASCNTEIGAAVSGVRGSASPRRRRRQYPNRLEGRDGGQIATRQVT